MIRQQGLHEIVFLRCIIAVERAGLPRADSFSNMDTSNAKEVTLARVISVYILASLPSTFSCG